MKLVRTILILFTIVLVNLAGTSQIAVDTTNWSNTICLKANFSIKYPPSFHVQNACGHFYKMSNGVKKIPIGYMTEKYFKGQDYLMHKEASTYKEWIEYRTRIMFSADGPHSSIYGDSIAKNIAFINSNGAAGNELYVYVSHAEYKNGEHIKTSTIKGPIFVFKRNQDIDDDEPTIFFHLQDDQCDKYDERLIRQMIDTFKFINK